MVPTPQLTQTVQVGWKEEATSGSKETLVAADYAGIHKDVQSGRNVNRYEPEAARATFSRLPSLPGSRMSTLNFSAQLLGGDANTPAKWHELALACGFQSESIYSADYSSASNADQLAVGQVIGDNADQGSAAKRAILVHIDTANSKIYYLPVTASEFVNTDTIYNYTTTQFTATIGSVPAQAGYSLRPLTPQGSDQHPTLTLEEIKGGYVNRIVGGRGTCSFRFAMNEPVLIQAQFQGPLDAPADGSSESKAFVENIPAPPTAKVVKGTVLRFTEDGQTPFVPVLTEATFDFGNTVSARMTAADNDVADSGYLPPTITDRAPTAAIDPEANISGFDIPKTVIDGATFDMLAEIGALTDVSGLIKFWVPNAQFDGDLEDTDRDGHQVYSPNVRLCGDNDNELYIFHLFA